MKKKEIKKIIGKIDKQLTEINQRIYEIEQFRGDSKVWLDVQRYLELKSNALCDVKYILLGFL